METNERNALAELAEWMEEQVDSFPVLANQFAWQDARDVSNIKKIRCILAELAKVQFLKNLDGEKISHPGDACHAVDICRAIAEEGV